MSDFAHRLIAWHAASGRHDLPWQLSRDPYRVWLSEIMLQQTQVDTVIPYYQRFLTQFPTLNALALAQLDEVLALWSGLGYYARARNLHRTAQLVLSEHSGIFPGNAAQLMLMPGIGRSTAAAIASFCFGERVPILDGNVKRVLCRHFGIEGFPGERRVEQILWQLAQDLLPRQDIEIYPQAQMDLGATVCTRSRPRCHACPLEQTCVAHQHGRVGELPTPRPRKAVPRRVCDMLLVKAQACVLLELRPQSGIWGGLYSLPEMLEGETPQAAFLRRLGLAMDGQAQAQEPIQHAFTHFTLTINPWLCELEVLPLQAQDPSLRWVTVEEFAAIGLPAPIRKLLEN